MKVAEGLPIILSIWITISRQQDSSKTPAEMFRSDDLALTLTVKLRSFRTVSANLTMWTYSSF